MSLFSTLRSADDSPLRRDRSAEVPRPQRTRDLEEGFALPRHLLVSLAGITSDVTSLQQRCVDAPELEVALERLLGRLDGLVDSIYESAAGPAAFSRQRTSPAATSPSRALEAVPVGTPDATDGAPTATQTSGALPSQPS